MLSSEEALYCYTDLLQFSKKAFFYNKKSEFVVGEHHKKICHYLEKVLLGKITRLIINIPPRYGKTELAVINFIAWALGLYPEANFLHASYSKQLASDNSKKVRDLVSSDFYKSLFKNIELQHDTTAKHAWRVTKGGGLYASGSGGSITGYGAGLKRKRFGGAIIIDDPHKADEAQSATTRQGVIDWFQTTMMSRINQKKTPIIVIGQRLHESDLMGFLLGGGNGEKWDSLILPAIDSQNKPLWSYHQKLEDLEILRASNPYVFNGQYLQNPTPPGGSLFKAEWWRYYEILPNIEYKIITGDTAQKTGEHNDYSVFQCWGVGLGNIYLIDQVRGKWEAPQLKQNLLTFYNKHNTIGVKNERLRRVYIEDKSSGTGLIQDIKQNNKLPIEGIQRNKDKITRALDVINYISAGYVFLPQNADFISDYLYEFASFSPAMTHKNDDQIDPTIDAIDILLFKKNQKAFFAYS